MSTCLQEGISLEQRANTHQGAHRHHRDDHAHKGRSIVKSTIMQGTKYTCPMHAEIVRDAPGDCPICGMVLVPIAGTGEADDTELKDLTRRFWVGAVLSVPLVLLAM